MCIAIYKPAKKTLSRELLVKAFEENGDGAGFAYANKGKLIVQKGFFTFKKFWNAFSKIQEGNPTIIHFRIATSGLKDERNCHPFLVNDDVAIVHNGILADWTPNNKCHKSDTRYFVDQVLKPVLEIVPDAYLQSIFQFLLERTIENGNKMVFLDSKGRHSILRKWAGHTNKDNGCWFSNDSYKRSRVSSLMKKDINELSEEEMDAIEEELAAWDAERAANNERNGNNFNYPKESRLSEVQQNYLDTISGESRASRVAAEHNRDKAIHGFLALAEHMNNSDFRRMMK